MTLLKGTYPALMTCMKEDGNKLNHAIDYDGFKQLIDYTLKEGVNGIVPSGCTGHAASLTIEEQIKLIAFARENVKEGTTVIAGDGSNCTREAISLAKELENIGIKIHLQISPYQNKPTQEGLYQHYAAIAEAINGEIIVYNVPGRTGKNIEADTTIRLAKEYSNIIAVKEASGNIEQINKISEQTSDLDFTVVSGDDGLTLDIIKGGGTGVISVAANIAPKLTSEMVNLALEKKYDEAAALNEKLTALFNIMFIETNPCPAHYAAKRLGIPAGTPRLPLVEVTDASKQKIDEVLKGLSLI